jgi:hypothetical protein
VSANEFLNPEEVEAKKAREEQESPKEKKSSKENSTSQNRRLVQIMNGEFLSRENFIANLPFTFYLASLLVIVIAWGYYAETVTRHEVKVEKELGELNAEYFTLGSEYNTMRGRRQIAERLKFRNVVESTDAPLKIKVSKYNLK